jgi:uncharacterized RDD family membrane protein YckC
VTTPPQDPSQGQFSNQPTQGYQAPPTTQYGVPPQAQPYEQQSYGQQQQGQYGAPGQYPTPSAYPGAPQAGFTAPSDPNQYSDWIHRVGAYLIDIAPVVVLGIIGDLTFKFIIIVLFWLAGIAWIAYNRWYQGGTTGQSLGKKLLGMKLISESTGQPIGPAMAFVRDLCHIIDSAICYVGYLFPLWDDKRQTIADKIVSTVVVPAPQG